MGLGIEKGGFERRQRQRWLVISRLFCGAAELWSIVRRNFSQCKSGVCVGVLALLAVALQLTVRSANDPAYLFQTAQFCDTYAAKSGRQRNSCKPCPPNGVCSAGIVTCHPRFVLTGQGAMRHCILDEAALEEARRELLGLLRNATAQQRHSCDKVPGATLIPQRSIQTLLSRLKNKNSKYFLQDELEGDLRIPGFVIHRVENGWRVLAPRKSRPWHCWWTCWWVKLCLSALLAALLVAAHVAVRRMRQQHENRLAAFVRNAIAQLTHKDHTTGLLHGPSPDQIVEFVNKCALRTFKHHEIFNAIEWLMHADPHIHVEKLYDETRFYASN